MKHYLNIEQWERKDHFLFFKDFKEPYFGITSEVECSGGYDFAKRKGVSFFLYYLYKALIAANTIVPFKYRIEDNKVACYDTINASSTIPRPNGTFGFSCIPFKESFEDYYTSAILEKERVMNNTDLTPASDQNNVIHFSAIPWVKFTSISHARHFDRPDSIPKISFGKIFTEGNKKMMPVAVHVNHALMDGYHVGQYFELFQNLLNEES